MSTFSFVTFRPICRIARVSRRQGSHPGHAHPSRIGVSTTRARCPVVDARVACRVYQSPSLNSGIRPVRVMHGCLSVIAHPSPSRRGYGREPPEAGQASGTDQATCLQLLWLVAGGPLTATSPTRAAWHRRMTSCGARSPFVRPRQAMRHRPGDGPELAGACGIQMEVNSLLTGGASW